MPTKALVAESDPFQCARISRVLAGLGYQVTEATDGLSAKEAINRGAAQDALVVDLSLPVADGFDVISHLRVSRKMGTPFVAAMSGLPSLRAQALKRKAELGIDDILSKTYDESTLGQILKRSATVLEQRKAQDEATAKASSQREEERLALMAGMHLTDNDGPPELGLQKIVEDAAKLFNVPVALISLVLEDQDWFLAHTGLTGKLLAERGSARADSFCTHVVQADQPETLVVPDAKEHPLFKDNPYVKDGTVGSYVGAPLKAANGAVLGTLCLIDTKPGGLRPAELAILNQLARRVAGELELLRQRQIQAAAPPEKKEADAVLASRFSLLAAAISQMPIGVLLMDDKRQVIVSNEALADMVGRPLSEIVGRPAADFARANIALFEDPSEYLMKMKLLPDGPYVADEDFFVPKPYPRRMRWMAKPILLPDGRQGQLDLFLDQN